MVVVAAFVVVVVAVAVVSRHLVDGPITPPAVMIVAGLATGLVTGSTGPDTQTTILIAEVTLSLVLFMDASRIAPRMLRHGTSLPSRLLGIGLPVSIALTTALGMVVLDLGLGPALLLGGALSATDAALAGIIVESDTLPRRLRQAVNVESGLNDGLATPVVTIAIAITLGAVQELEGVVGEFLVPVGGAVALGGVTGALGGWLLRSARQRDIVDPTWAQLGTLGIIGVAIVVSMALGVIAFVAAFVAGLAFRACMGPHADEVSDHTKDTAQFLTAGAFFLFGLLLPSLGLGGVTMGEVVVAVLSLTVVRMAAVALAMWGTEDAWQTVAMIGWVGPRGLATVLFGLIAIEEAGAAVPRPAVWVLVLAVFGSVAAHGITAAPLTRRYAHWLEGHTAEAAQGPGRPVDPMADPAMADLEVGRTRR